MCAVIIIDLLEIIKEFIDLFDVLSKYNLTKLKALEDLVATAVEENIPFNNIVTGYCAFTHKAAIHGE